MDFITLFLIIGLTMWLVVLTALTIKMLRTQESHRIELMKERARVNKYVDFGNPIRSKVRPIMGKSEAVTIDLTELDDEIIL